ncbi:MAG: MbcA/ParS/Xre antitoxin family protein [Candidatus Thiodiazotropha sp. (ex. Lucinisca nassula)]|nr:MbcA/ParS/Xre antitoxin family protein [Candidatus Thiodiazotropha sp. (ex. Lucinisca nassula)]MBW9273871.1 MbcA/ParS/Xre antitoxin family protein [Candidatus Thiodiazotropha sp. (ex. Lucinisca nassula)]
MSLLAELSNQAKRTHANHEHELRLIFKKFRDNYPDIAAIAVDILGDEAHYWMASPNRSLKGLMPYESLIDDQKNVIDLFMRVKHGIW